MNSCYFKIQKEKHSDNINMDHKKTLMNVAQDLVRKQAAVWVAMKISVPQTGHSGLTSEMCRSDNQTQAGIENVPFLLELFFLQELAMSLLLNISTL